MSIRSKDVFDWRYDRITNWIYLIDTLSFFYSQQDLLVHYVLSKFVKLNQKKEDFASRMYFMEVLE